MSHRRSTTNTKRASDRTRCAQCGAWARQHNQRNEMDAVAGWCEDCLRDFAERQAIPDYGVRLPRAAAAFKSFRALRDAIQ